MDSSYFDTELNVGSQTPADGDNTLASNMYFSRALSGKTLTIGEWEQTYLDRDFNIRRKSAALNKHWQIFDRGGEANEHVLLKEATIRRLSESQKGMGDAAVFGRGIRAREFCPSHEIKGL